MKAPDAAKHPFVIATPGRSVCDDNARALERHGLLRFIALGTRRGTAGVPPEHTRLNPKIGFATYVSSRLLSASAAESFRFHLHPWFDRWVAGQLTPGNHIISSYGYANESFEWVRAHGGKTFLDGGNSHPENYWAILEEEHRRWNCAYPPMPRHHYERSLAMIEHVDFVLSPSSYVSRSFLERGFKPGQILKNVYPADLSLFRPSGQPRPKDRPLTIINTGSLSLRKGTPYLLEAFRIVHNKIPKARLLLTNAIQNDVKPILSRYRDLPIDWAPPLPHAQLSDRLRSADIFVLPSLEDGFARTVTEAMACGLPAIVTANTGASDLIKPGVNGAIVPIRDPQATAEAVLNWGNVVLRSGFTASVFIDTDLLQFNRFEHDFIQQLHGLNLIESQL